MKTLREAAQAVIDRWDTPLWKDVPATANYINDLRAELAAPQAHTEATSLIMRDVCETEPADPSFGNTICIDRLTLQRIVEEHLAAPQEPVAWIGPKYFTAFSRQGYQVATHKIASDLVPLYAAPQANKFSVLAVTTAYEQGVGKGKQRRDVACPYVPGDCHEAWQLGYDEGKRIEQAKEQGPRVFVDSEHPDFTPDWASYRQGKLDGAAEAQATPMSEPTTHLGGGISLSIDVWPWSEGFTAHHEYCRKVTEDSI